MQWTDADFAALLDGVVPTVSVVDPLAGLRLEPFDNDLIQRVRIAELERQVAELELERENLIDERYDLEQRYKLEEESRIAELERERSRPILPTVHAAGGWLLPD